MDGEKYFLINKNLFYFFHMVYGGGPAIVNAKKYYNHEVKEDPKVTWSTPDGPQQTSDNERNETPEQKQR